MKVVVLFVLLGAVLGLSPEEIRRGFKPLDINNDGTVTKIELEQYFNNIDTNRDDFATLEEYTASLPGVPKLKVQSSFNFYDKEDGTKDGKITRETSNKFFDRLDLNKDGEVTFEEFTLTYPPIRAAIEEEIKALAG